jgi:hypothetical protein
MEAVSAATARQAMCRAAVVAIVLVATVLYAGMASVQPPHATVPGRDCTAPTVAAKHAPANINLLPRLGEAQLVAHYQVDMTKAPKATVPPQRATPHAGQPGEPTSPMTASAEDVPRNNVSAAANPCTSPGNVALPQSAP